MLPNFLIVGAPKAATTWLADCLREHPQVFVPKEKELRYFCGGNYAQGHGWYERHFDSVEGEIAVGEASPSYLGSADAPARIRALLPDARLILSLRHPVEQAYSFYWHQVSRGALPESLDFRRFFSQQRPRAGRYGEHVSRYLECFPAGQMLILLYETEVAGDPLHGLRKCQEFLGVDTGHLPQAAVQRRNAARDLSVMHAPAQAFRRGINRLPGGLKRSVKRVAKAALSVFPARRRHAPLDPELSRDLLRAHCLDDLHRLEAVAGLDLGVWYDR